MPNGAAAVPNLFGESGNGDTSTPGETLIAMANRIDGMARELILEVTKFREKLDRSSAAAREHLTEAELATKAEKQNHPIKSMLTYFDAAHLKKFKEPATINGGRDAGIMKRLISQHGEDKLRALVDQFFECDDDWLVRQGYTVVAFGSRIPALIAGRHVPLRTVGATRNTANNGRSAGVAADMIRQQYSR